MDKSVPGTKVNDNLESLRGYAALFVVICHMVILGNVFNKLYVPTALLELSPDGHIWVLIFFVLSGYVISISNNASLSKGSIGLYLKKRFVRIYPIYFIVIAFALLISTEHYSLFEIVMNFALMQVLVVSPLVQDGPTWSLHFEILYYLLYIPVSFFKLNPLAVLGIALIIAFGNYGLYPDREVPIISSYLFGFVFWVAGLCIAQYTVPAKASADPKVLIAVLLLILSTSEMFYRSGLAQIFDNISSVLFHRHLIYSKVDIYAQTIITHEFLIFLPFCVYAVCVFSGKKFKNDRGLWVLLHLLILAGITITLRDYFVLGKKSAHIFHFFLSVGYYVVSCILPFLNIGIVNRLSNAIVRFGSWTGRISYAIYILHCPLMYAMGRIDFFNSSWYSFVVRFVIFFALLFALSFLLESKLQPIIKKYLMRSRVAAKRQIPAVTK